MSVPGFTSPSVSSMNFVYNIIAISSGIHRYFRLYGRPLTWFMIIGILLDVFFGYYSEFFTCQLARLQVLRCLVLSYIGGRLLYEVSGRVQASQIKMDSPQKRLSKLLRPISRPLNTSSGANGFGSEFLVCLCSPSLWETLAANTALEAAPLSPLLRSCFPIAGLHGSGSGCLDRGLGILQHPTSSKWALCFFPLTGCWLPFWCRRVCGYVFRRSPPEIHSLEVHQDHVRGRDCIPGTQVQRAVFLR